MQKYFVKVRGELMGKPGKNRFLKGTTGELLPLFFVPEPWLSARNGLKIAIKGWFSLVELGIEIKDIQEDRTITSEEAKRIGSIGGSHKRYVKRNA